MYWENGIPPKDYTKTTEFSMLKHLPLVIDTMGSFSSFFSDELQTRRISHIQETTPPLHS